MIHSDFLGLSFELDELARSVSDLLGRSYALTPLRVRCTYPVFHSWGAHPPWAKDQRTTVRDKLTRLGALMDVYRARGLYDKSLIVVTTDHGNGTAPALDGYPPQASALLWVKPEGADGAFAFSDLKTSHAKICELVKAACGRQLTSDDVALTLRTENRIYRREEGRNNFKDYGERK